MKNYSILKHDYTNTGGNCMVSTFTIQTDDRDELLYLHVNDEGGTLATVDYINQDVDYEQSMDIESFSLNSVSVDDENFELYRHCWIEYFKKDCKYNGYNAILPYFLLTKELQEQVHAQLFETNGYKINPEEPFFGDY